MQDSVTPQLPPFFSPHQLCGYEIAFNFQSYWTPWGETPKRTWGTPTGLDWCRHQVVGKAGNQSSITPPSAPHPPPRAHKLTPMLGAAASFPSPAAAACVDSLYSPTLNLASRACKQCLLTGTPDKYRHKYNPKRHTHGEVCVCLTVNLCPHLHTRVSDSTDVPGWREPATAGVWQQGVKEVAQEDWDSSSAFLEAVGPNLKMQISRVHFYLLGANPVKSGLICTAVCVWWQDTSAGWVLGAPDRGKERSNGSHAVYADTKSSLKYISKRKGPGHCLGTVPSGLVGWLCFCLCSFSKRLKLSCECFHITPWDRELSIRTKRQRPDHLHWQNMHSANQWHLPPPKGKPENPEDLMCPPLLCSWEVPQWQNEEVDLNHL